MLILQKAWAPGVLNPRQYGLRGSTPPFRSRMRLVNKCGTVWHRTCNQSLVNRCRPGVFGLLRDARGRCDDAERCWVAPAQPLCGLGLAGCLMPGELVTLTARRCGAGVFHRGKEKGPRAFRGPRHLGRTVVFSRSLLTGAVRPP